MRKGFKIVYSFIFLIICALPLCLMPFVKNNAKIEKRELNKLPSFVSDGRLNIDFSSQFEAWFNDRIPFRSQLLSTANIIKGEALHTPTSNVIVGKDGWLFYESEGDDYMNTNALTDNQVSAIAVTLSLIEENITNKGGRFLFVPMPNKASVYGEYMPSSYEKADENNLTRVMDKVNELGVNYVDMKAVMTANKDKDYKWMLEHQQGDVTFTDVSDQYAQIAVQGPKAMDVISKLAKEEDIPKLVQVLCRGDGRTGSISGFVTLNEDDCAKIYKMMV